MALTSDRPTVRREPLDFVFPVEGTKKCITGGIAVINAAGYAEPATTATGKKAVGVFQETVDNTNGADGAVSVKVRRGCYRFDNSTAGDAITLADVNDNCYLVDDHTVAKTNGSSTRSVAGKIVDVDSVGVWVQF